ncbi:solute carrier family 2 (facilitated glucose transporter), member 9-like 1 [Silurus asotus]|uniref:Solute carrier family 2, facilitated glucose transporter member 5 n=1 Tax=Silurus asotus TaxID=30991 RepID=A0AAD4ZZG1_SILAS|nr:solute carrier family 2 (facilitated glucose transporter), member 9-like 1 [Silurus asotus]
MGSFLMQLLQGRALLFIIVLGLGGSFQIGCHITLISSPSPFIQSFINSSWTERYGEAPGEDTLDLIWATVVSIYSIGGLFGAISVSCVISFLGRKKAMIWSNVLSIAAAGIMVMSKDAKSFEMILLSRFLFGVTSGLVGNIHPIYLGESAPKKIRGTVSVTMATFSSIGKLTGQIAGLSEILGQEHLWNILLCVPAFFSFVQMITLPFFPEAPRYLLIEKGQTEECRKAMQCLWGPGDYKLEIEEMQMEQDALKGQRSRSVLELLKDSEVRWQCLSLVILYEAIQFCGIAGISLFAYSIFKEAGIPVNKIRYVTLGVGASEILTSITCSLLIDRVGRRVLLWGGFGIMAGIMLLLSITLQLKDYDFWVPYTTVGLVFLFVICYGGGPAGVSVPLGYEMFVQSHRSAAFTLMGVLIWGSFSVFGFVFPFVLSAMKSFSFLIFSCVCMVASLYMFFVLPETKGKTPLEIAEDFKKIRACRSPAEAKRLETKL